MWVSTPKTQILDADADGPIGAMGCQRVGEEMGRDVLNWLPAPADGVIHLSADKTRKDKGGRKHPLGLNQSTRDSYT